MLIMSVYLSYLMGAKDIQDKALEDLNIEIAGRDGEDRMLKIPQQNIPQYIELIKAKLTPGFWNEVVGEKEIIFIFKFKDGTIKEFTLSPENEPEVDKLCAEFANESPDKTANVYKFISENEFYRDFMQKHYSSLINRQ